MPCEGCQVQFTVFRRKRSCSECRRYYCSNCLSSTKRGNGAGHSLLLCQRCAIFAKRPLLRSDLLQLKPKDLIFYLQSKHISTAGCVEKDELVCLVLNHAQQVDASRLNGHGQGGQGTDYSHHGRASADTTNSFDSIKQTCQNFFTNISDNLTESFTNLDGRDNANKQQQQSQRHAPYNNGERHGGPTVEQQPVRVHTREIPTYASYQREQQRTNSSQTQPQQPQMPTQTNNLPAASTTTSTTRTTKSPTEHSTRTAESLAGTTTTSHVANTNTTTPTNTSTPPNTSSSPTYSVSTVSSARVQNDVDLNDEAASTSTLSTASKRNDEHEHNKSDCECSDDEMIADFSARHSLKTDTATTSQRLTPEQQQERTTTRERDVVGGGPSTSNASTTNYSKVGGGGSTFSSKVDVCDVSSQSSFEELGAIGGISDESRPTTETTNSSVNMEQWMMLEVPTTANESSSSEQMADVEQNNEDQKLAIKTQRSDLPKLRLNQQQPPQRKPKVQRRRSDSYLNRRHNELLTPTSPTATNLPIHLNQSALSGLAVEEHEMHPCEVEPSTSRRRQSCTRCGKNKTNLRHQVEKMRRHLESAQMSDEDIKREIKEFLEYLEMRTKSMDHSDSETVGSSMSAAANLTQVATMVQTPSPMDDNDGIHVYASTSSYDGGESRFINLEDFDNMDDLECLTVKQLKEILMLHRVDYKGCCEKQELLERVERLWKNLKTTPAVEKLPTDELCKICMDAPIECVILECGHMATCTNCGKVLSECPICRQYIVRVVRFFRA